MGIWLYSRAEIISTEPEVLKELIEKIVATEEVSCIDDLKIEGNSVLFNSGGYGTYGSDPDYSLMMSDSLMLFKCLFEKYDKALVCFEIVSPCQAQGYYFSATWAKPDGKIDFDEEENWDENYDRYENESFYIYREVWFEDEADFDESGFDYGETWFMSFKLLNEYKLKLPNIKKLINLAQEAGFTDWEINPSTNRDDQDICDDIPFDPNQWFGISMLTIYTLGDYLEEYLDKYDDELVSNARYEAEEECMYVLSEIKIDDARFKLPSDFPKLKSAFAKAYEKKQERIKATIENEVEFDFNKDTTLYLRTKDNLIELLQVGKSGVWDIAQDQEKQIYKIKIFSWDGSLMLEASHDISKSKRTENDLLIIGLYSKDAKIVKSNYPYKWIEQNTINNLDETIKEKNNELTEIETKNLDEQIPHAPDGFDVISPNVAELCEHTYGEPIRLIYWQMNDEKQQFNTLFREVRRGWYIQMLLTEKDGEWFSEYRVLPSFLNLLEPDETIWSKLTQKATKEDWYALDEIFLNTLVYSGSNVILAGSDLIGEEVAEQAMEEFGFYIPDNDLLPALLFDNSHLKVKLLSYFKHQDGFARENMISDENTDQCEVLNSLIKAQRRLNQKLSYYKNES